ncbi:MAG: hypothetical protein AB1898_25870 [Acidobacteriota bacterium]
MRCWVCAVPLVVALAVAVYGQQGPANVLKIRPEANPIVRGKPSVVTLAFEIKPGFKIAKRPSPKLQLTAPEGMEVRGSLGLDEGGHPKDPEYFGAIKPLSLQVSAGTEVSPGQQKLSGKFVYFYCSEAEKYCSRSVEEVVVPLEVRASR